MTIYLKKHKVNSSEDDDDDALSEIEYFDDTKDKVRFVEADLADDSAFTQNLFVHLCEQKLFEKKNLNKEEQTFMVLWNQHAHENHSIISKSKKKTTFEALLQSFIPILAETIITSGETCLRDCFVRLLCSVSTIYHGLLTIGQIVTFTNQLDEIVNSFKERVYKKFISDYVSSFY